MNRGPIIHGALLVVALLVAYQTWTRPDEVPSTRGSVVLWEGKPEQVASVEYLTDRKTILIERRDGYLWGKVTRVTTKPKKKPATRLAPEGVDQPDAGPAVPEATAANQALDAGTAEPAPSPDQEAETTTVTSEFPVGEQGDELINGLSTVRMLRDLGEPIDDQLTEFGLADSKTQVTVQLGDQSRTLLVGTRVFGGSDRYVQDPTTNRVYIMPGETLRPIEGGDQALRDRKIVPAKLSDIRRATISTAIGERTLVRGEVAGPHGRNETTWADLATPDSPDQTVANFLSRLERLAPNEFLPELQTEGMTSVIRIDYEGNNGKDLGQLELFKRPGDKPGQLEYYIYSKRTRVPAKVHRLSAERIDSDISTLFTSAE